MMSKEQVLEQWARFVTVREQNKENFPYTNCAICHTELTIHQYCVLNKCTHVFHIDCITAWLKLSSTCPICRITVDQRTFLSSGRTVTKEVPQIEKRDRELVKCHIHRNIDVCDAAVRYYMRTCKFRGPMELEDYQNIVDLFKKKASERCWSNEVIQSELAIYLQRFMRYQQSGLCVDAYLGKLEHEMTQKFEDEVAQQEVVGLVLDLVKAVAQKVDNEVIMKKDDQKDGGKEKEEECTGPIDQPTDFKFAVPELPLKYLCQ
ncbi:unnamed protein product [Caenorhabditis bovis]|uniref:RING-type domain-containing protein n=1 Tax=Caenorhabditis bovis TaxID=2654633 RepID=A0A8S1E7I5_9PELO|nr:unnamed protein product [Caenorhabditis bovis]